MVEPRKPDNVRYMTGWFLVKYKGDMKKARQEAKKYVAALSGSG